MMAGSLLLLAACAPQSTEGLADDAVIPCDAATGTTTLTWVGGEQPQIDWAGGAVWAVAITSPGARIGAMGTLESGLLYWQVAATEFGDTLEGPLRYGQVPANATDYTSFAGGTFDTLEAGHCYEIQVSDPTHEGFARHQFRPSH